MSARKTSVSLEDTFWDELVGIASQKKMPVGKLVAEINGQKRGGNLSSAIRLYVLSYVRARRIP
jgi:predicted DNA-binding ribbon-helix-helix protein